MTDNRFRIVQDTGRVGPNCTLQEAVAMLRAHDAAERGWTIEEIDPAPDWVDIGGGMKVRYTGNPHDLLRQSETIIEYVGLMLGEIHPVIAGVPELNRYTDQFPQYRKLIQHLVLRFHQARQVLIVHEPGDKPPFPITDRPT